MKETTQLEIYDVLEKRLKAGKRTIVIIDRIASLDEYKGIILELMDYVKRGRLATLL